MSVCRRLTRTPRRLLSQPIAEGMPMLNQMRITTSDARTIYTRALPGGGYVAIRAREVRRLFRDPICRGEIVVERRDEKRRAGHVPPTVKTADARDVAALW